MIEKDYINAKINVEKALLIKPDHKGAYSNLGLIYFYTKDYKKAEQIFESLYKETPTNINVIYNLGLTYSVQFEKIELALEKFNEILKINSSHELAKEKISDLNKSLDYIKRICD
jgi:tetratricopeptide (TPR) repeat protein